MKKLVFILLLILNSTAFSYYNLSDEFLSNWVPKSKGGKLYDDAAELLKDHHIWWKQYNEQ